MKGIFINGGKQTSPLDYDSEKHTVIRGAIGQLGGRGPYKGILSVKSGRGRRKVMLGSKALRHPRASWTGSDHDFFMNGTPSPDPSYFSLHGAPQVCHGRLASRRPDSKSRWTPVIWATGRNRGGEGQLMWCPNRSSQDHRRTACQERTAFLFDELRSLQPWGPLPQQDCTIDIQSVLG